MVRLADQEMPAIEKIVSYSVPKRRGDVMQEAPELVGDRGGEVKEWASDFIGVLQEGMSGAG